MIIPDNLVVIDLETSGLNPVEHGILEIGAVKLATGEEFECRCRLGEEFKYDPRVYPVNHIGESEARDERFMSETAAVSELLMWLGSGPKWMQGGSYPQFDLGFLHQVALESALILPMGRQLLDLATVAVTYCIATGTQIPKSLSADSIYRMLGLPEEPRPHRALQGARAEAHAFRTMFNRLALAQGQALNLRANP